MIMKKTFEKGKNVPVERLTHVAYILSPAELAIRSRGPLPYANAALHPGTDRVFYYTSRPECGPEGVRGRALVAGPFPRGTNVVVLMGPDGRLTPEGKAHELATG